MRRETLQRREIPPRNGLLVSYIQRAQRRGNTPPHGSHLAPVTIGRERLTHTHVDAQTAMHERVGNDKAGMQTVFVTMTPMHILVARFLLRIVNEKLCSPVGSPFSSSRSYSSV